MESNSLLQVLQIVVEERRDEVMIHVVERLCQPARGLEILLIEQVQVGLHVVVRLAKRFLLMTLQVFEQLVVALLGVLDIRLVLHRRFQLHHVLPNDRLHLQRIEVLLIVQHVTQGVLVILDLLELYEKHVVEFVEILFHVVNGYTPRQLEEDGFNPTVELALHLSNFRIVFLVRLRVLFHPELGVGDHLVHASLQILMSRCLPGHFGTHVGDLLRDIRLGPQHHVLHLLEILLVLIKLGLKRHRCVDFLLKVHLGLVDLLDVRLELLLVIGVDLLGFTLLYRRKHRVMSV